MALEQIIQRRALLPSISRYCSILAILCLKQSICDTVPRQSSIRHNLLSGLSILSLFLGPPYTFLESEYIYNSNFIILRNKAVSLTILYKFISTHVPISHNARTATVFSWVSFDVYRNSVILVISYWNFGSFTSLSRIRQNITS